MTRWTRRDDEALREQVEAEEFAREHVIPALAELLGVDEQRLQDAAPIRAVPVRPCTHWRCLWAHATRPANRRPFIAGLLTAAGVYVLLHLIGALS